MRFLIELVYCMTWIWTLHRAHNKSKSPIEEENIWASLVYAQSGLNICNDRSIVYLPTRSATVCDTHVKVPGYHNVRYIKFTTQLLESNIKNKTSTCL